MSSETTNTLKGSIKTPTKRSPSKVERTQSSIGDSRRVYDVPTLLNIGRRLGSKSDPVVLNVIPDAVPSGRRRGGDNILKEKTMNRHSRGCSGSSSGSSTLQDTVRRASHRVPSRQPAHPPQGTLAQSNAGFAKFLKEHTSPKHQRVTAGGRIVPFELDTKVAPEFKLPVKSDGQDKGQRSPSNQSVRITPNRKPKGPGQDRPIQASGNFKPKPIPVVGLSPFDSTPTAAPSQAGSNARPSSPGQQPQQQRNMTFPNPAAPLFQPSTEATSVNACNFMNNVAEQPNWSAAPCFSSMSQPPQPPMLPGMYNFGIPTCTSPGVTQPTPQLFQFPPAGAVLNASAPIAAQPLLQPWASTQALEDATREFENISKELEDLDRYLAIRFQIDPTAKRILVEQRMELVEKKNAARAAKEWIEQTLEQNSKQNITPNAAATDSQFLQQPQQPASDATAVYQSGLGSQPSPWISNLMPSFTGSNGYASPIANPNLFLPPYQPLAPPIPAIGGFAGQVPTSSIEKQFTFKAPEAGETQDTATAGQSAKRDNAWDKAPENAPPEIMRVYQNLEDAVKRGANLEPHLQELSRAILNLKHKRSMVQRQRTVSRELARDGSKAKSSNSELNVLTSTAVNEKAQGEALPRKASGTENNEKRRFRKKKEPRQNKKESKKSAATSSSNDEVKPSDESVEPSANNDPTKHFSSSSTYTNRGSSSATSEPVTNPSTASRLRYDAATFTPLKQQVESQMKAAEAGAVQTTVTAYWAPTMPDSEAVQSLSRSSGNDPMKTKEATSGGIFGWFRRALSPSPESQAARGFAQNIRQNEKESRKASHGGKRAPKARAS